MCLEFMTPTQTRFITMSWTHNFSVQKGGENMLIKIGDFEFTEVWDGVLYKKLSDYPKVSDWEIRNLIESS